MMYTSTLRNLLKIICSLLLCSVVTVSAQRVLQVGDTVFSVAEHNGWFLGLTGIEWSGVPLQVEGSLVFPLVVDDWAETPVIGSGLKLARIAQVDGGWDLHLTLYAGAGREDWSAFFEWDADAGTIRRDEFRFGRIEPLATLNRSAVRKAYLDERGRHLQVKGTLVWQLRAHKDNIAGWPWQGWKWRVLVNLDQGMRTSAIRMIGGFETGGTLHNLTLANQRYRGLGNLEQTLRVDAQGLSASTFNTQDNFARPSPLPEGFVSGNSAEMEREKAMSIRRNAWIHVMGRGAGTGFFDFQFNASTALLGYPARQGNFRALTEIYQGDAGLGQSSEEHFGYTARWQGEWMLFSVLRMDGPRGNYFWRTRYLEVDRELRARISEELNFLNDRVVPTVGYLFDFWSANDNFAQVVARMVNYAGHLAEIGIRRVKTHNPGWVNGRAVSRGWDGADPAYVASGRSVNQVYDWTPLPDVRQPWIDLSRMYDQLGIEHYVWISGMTQNEASFTREVGQEPENWALNSPGGPPNETYGVDRLKHNILSPRFAAVWNQRFDDLRRDFGFAGYWGDSFQNLMMSQLNWAGGNGEPMQRGWWEWLAEQSHAQRGWISESHSFPGLSCSIETENQFDYPWMLGQVIRWLRGTEQMTRPPEEWGRLLFRVMAFDAWLAPEIWPYYVDREVDPERIIDRFSEYTQSFNAAMPMMQRPYILPENRGVLWLNPELPGRGVLFPFTTFQHRFVYRLPDGVSGHPILNHTGQMNNAAVPYQVTLVYGDDLVRRFGIESPPFPDQRTPMQERPLAPNLLEGPAVWHWRQTPGSHQLPVWASGADGWRLNGVGQVESWPSTGDAIAKFAAGTNAALQVLGTVRSKGILTATPGVSLIVDTVRDGGPGDLLEVAGPLAGPMDIYFRGTLRERGTAGLFTLLREQTGLRFSGGGNIAVSANLLPWLENPHLHSQVVSLTEPGTTVHFYGQWPATGELSRPGLILDEGTRFVVWPEASMPFIKNYGGFTLQWWVGRGSNGGGILELHQEFVADRSRNHVNPFDPNAADLRLGSIGSIWLNGVTLITHDSRNLPLTGRIQDEADGSIQNNGHLVFAAPHGGRWEVRTRAQTYRGAVWIDADTTIFTDRDLTLIGVTEPADSEFNYVAANAFQTRRGAGLSEGMLVIRKEGPASLILAGEQAYIQGTSLHLAGGRVVFQSDPATGRMFPDGRHTAGPNLSVDVASVGTLEIATETVGLAALSVQAGGVLRWSVSATVEVAGSADLNGILQVPGGLTAPTVLLQAVSISGAPVLEGASGTIEVRAHNETQQLVFIPSN